jgi:hypothetical protein
VGIVDPRGELCGAGVLLSDRLVLTCAHVVRQGPADEPAERIGIEFVGLPGQPRGGASVMAGHWIPAREDQCGDVALLELDRPVAARVSAPLRNVSTRNKDVKVQGYPHGVRARSEWALATTVGPCGPEDEWVQLIPRSPVGPWVRRGFSGAGVLDEATGDIVGIVVAKEGSDTAYMIPMDTVAVYLSPVASLVAGDAAADPAFVTKVEDRLNEMSGDRDDVDGSGVRQAARALGDRLRQAAPGTVLNVVGPAEAERSTALAMVVSFSDPVSRRRLPAEAVSSVPSDLVLPARSVDLAIDATGQTTQQLAMRIAERIGFDSAGAGLVDRVVPAAAALFLVVDSADDAATPDSLLRDLLGPVAAAVPHSGGKLVVGSRTELLPGPAVMYVGGVSRERLDRLDKAVADAAAAVRLARERHAEVAPRVTGAPDPGKLSTASAKLSIVAHGLRAADRVDEAALADGERAAARLLRDARELFDRLNALLDRRNELRRLLDAYKERTTGPLVEDPELARLYRAARDALWQAPCGLDDAQDTVHRYTDAVRHRRGEGGAR